MSVQIPKPADDGFYYLTKKEIMDFHDADRTAWLYASKHGRIRIKTDDDPSQDRVYEVGGGKITVPGTRQPLTPEQIAQKAEEEGFELYKPVERRFTTSAISNMSPQEYQEHRKEILDHYAKGKILDDTSMSQKERRQRLGDTVEVKSEGPNQ